MARKTRREKTSGTKTSTKTARWAKGDKGNNTARSRPRRRVRSPRSIVLPGLEQVRNRKLDNVCEGIGDERRTMNAARIEEQSLVAAAQQVMEGASPTLMAYKHAGVELVLVPGSSKLRVRLTKDTGDADHSGGTTRANNAEDTETVAVDSDDESSEDEETPF